MGTTIWIPQPVDEAIVALSGRRGLSGEMEMRIVSIVRTVIRAFAEASTDMVEIDKALDRVRRCIAIIGPEPSSHPDAPIAGDLRRLAHLLQTPAGPVESPRPAAAVPAAVNQPFIPRVPGVPRVNPSVPQARGAAPARRPAPPPVVVQHAMPVVHRFSEAAAARAQRDWYWFALDELNGLGGLLVFQRKEKQTEAAARTEQRIRETLGALGWDPAATLNETWAFAQQRLQDFDEGWAPHLVLFTLEPTQGRVRDWLAGLPREMQTAIESNPIDIKRGTG